MNDIRWSLLFTQLVGQHRNSNIATSVIYLLAGSWPDWFPIFSFPHLHHDEIEDKACALSFAQRRHRLISSIVLSLALIKQTSENDYLACSEFLLTSSLTGARKRTITQRDPDLPIRRTVNFV